jgi:ferredoxin-NADP reductase
MLQPWQDAVVTKIVQETPTTKRFFLALSSGQVFDFIPGSVIYIPKKETLMSALGL